MSGGLRRIVRGEGRLLPDAEGAWLHRADGRLALADLDRGELHSIRFGALDDARAIAPLPDREHVARLRGDAIELVHRERGVVASRSIPPRPNGPYPGDGPAWDGLLSCDDLGLLTSIALPSGRRRVRSAWALPTDDDGYAIGTDGGTAAWAAPYVAAVASDAARVLASVEVRDDADEDDVDGFPPRVLASLDPGGVVALVEGDEVAFCRWA